MRLLRRHPSCPPWSSFDQPLHLWAARPLMPLWPHSVTGWDWQNGSSQVRETSGGWTWKRSGLKDRLKTATVSTVRNQCVVFTVTGWSKVDENVFYDSSNALVLYLAITYNKIWCVLLPRKPFSHIYDPYKHTPSFTVPPGAMITKLLYVTHNKLL